MCHKMCHIVNERRREALSMSHWAVAVSRRWHGGKLIDSGHCFQTGPRESAGAIYVTQNSEKLARKIKQLRISADRLSLCFAVFCRYLLELLS
jgi:hypothetical protein